MSAHIPQPLTPEQRLQRDAWKLARRGRSGPVSRADRRRAAKYVRKAIEEKRAACRRFGISGKRFRAPERKARRERAS